MVNLVRNKIQRTNPTIEEGKDDDMLEQWLNGDTIASVLKTTAIVLIGAACVGGYFLHKERARKKEDVEQRERRNAEIARKEQGEKQKAEAIRKEQEAKREALVDRYCEVCRELDCYRDWEAYCESFLAIGPFLQLLLGSERSRRVYGTPDEKLVKSLLRAVNNFCIKDQVTETGVLVETTASSYDEVRVRQSCENANISRIEAQLGKNELTLAQYRRYMDGKGILNACGSCLYKTVCSIAEGNAEEIFRNIRELAELLEASGCHAIFVDDMRVALSESLRIDFREDGATATELPGLYTEENGKYCRIGNLGGTMRRA